MDRGNAGLIGLVLKIIFTYSLIEMMAQIFNIVMIALAKKPSEKTEECELYRLLRVPSKS
jgi:hypothetical protein